jgi:murein DD-endopeptidase MepM/ murein hydrolase activator NlpD
MSIFKYLKNLKSFSLIIVPDNTSHEARTRKFTAFKIFLFVIIYSVIISMFGYYFFSITGLGSKFLPGSVIPNTQDVKELKQLNTKVYFLAKELEALKSVNQRLKFALALGDSTIADSLDIKPDSLEKFYKKPIEGGLFGSILSLVNLIFNQQDNNSVFFIFPVNGYISRGFDSEKGHNGIDIVVKDGTPVYATAGGFVIFSGYTTDYGHIIIINHPDGYISIYKHCSLILKREREIVKQGELIAQSGNSGLATTGPHLHFEIWKNGQPIDPEKLLIKN